MSDERLRELERRYLLGDVAAGVRLLRARLRRRAVDADGLQAAALAGDRAAAQVLGVTDAIARIERYLTEHHPELLEGLRPPLDPAELPPIEAALGSRLPGPLVELYLWRGGQSLVEPVPSFYAVGWRLISAGELPARRRELYEAMGRELPGAGGLLPVLWWKEQEDDADGEQEEVEAQGSDGAQDDGDDPEASFHAICVDLDGGISARPGHVLEVKNGLGAEVDITLLFPSLDRWLVTYAEALDAGLWEPDRPLFSSAAREDAAAGEAAEPGEDSRPLRGLRAKDAYDAFVEEYNPGYPRPLDVPRAIRNAWSCGGCAALLALAAAGFHWWREWYWAWSCCTLPWILFFGWVVALQVEEVKRFRRRERVAREAAAAKRGGAAP